MDGDRWTSKWQPSTSQPQGDRWREERHRSWNSSGNATGHNLKSSATVRVDRWSQSDVPQNRTDYDRRTPPSFDSRRGGDLRPVPEASRQGQQAPAKKQPSANGWDSDESARGTNNEPQGVADIMDEMYDGLDPTEPVAGRLTSEAWGSVPGGWSGDDMRPGKDSSTGAQPPRTNLAYSSLAKLEEAVAYGDQHGWSLERIAEAAAALGELLVSIPPGLDPAVRSSPMTQRERGIMDALAAAALRLQHSQSPTLPPATQQRACAAAQLLWACGRAEYWSAPPVPAPGARPMQGARIGGGGGGVGTSYVARAREKAAASAEASVREAPRPVWPAPHAAAVAERDLSGVTGSAGVAILAKPATWSRLISSAAASSNAQDPAVADTALCTKSLASLALPDDNSPGTTSTFSASTGPASSDATPNPTTPTADDSSVPENTDRKSPPAAAAEHFAEPADAPPSLPLPPSWRPLAVVMLELLRADDCRLVTLLDCRSLAFVWWALAKASSAARRRRRVGAPDTDATAVVAAASPSLMAALDSRAATTLRSATTPELCSLVYSCAATNHGSARLLKAAGDALKSQLDGAWLQGPAGGQRGERFSARELSCLAYAYGLLGFRHEQLVAAMIEYVISTDIKWTASFISVFMYGISSVAHRDPRLVSWAENVALSIPPHTFDLRNVAFLLGSFHRLRCWPRRAADRLLQAVVAHPPEEIPMISISNILMAMGAGRARHDPALAHLSVALVRRPGRNMTPKDVCICLTALQRLHEGNILASQLPEVLEALDHLAAAIVQRGFSQPGPGGRAVPVFNHQEVSNVILALGKLKYHNPAVLRALREHAARGGLDGSSAWDCTFTLVGLAALNYSDREQQREEAALAAAAAGAGAGPCGGGGGGVVRALDVDLVGLLASVVAANARSAKCQDLANTLWALSVLEGALERYRPEVTALVEESNRRGTADRVSDGFTAFNVDEQRQFFHVHRELSALPEPYVRLKEDLVRLGRLGMSEADHTYSRVQATFQSTLGAMYRDGRFSELRELLFEQELVPGGEQLLRIDAQAMIERPGPNGTTTVARVAVEFDGPWHFMVNEPYTARIDGRTALRNRILTRHLGEGNVVCVSMAEWVAASREPTRGMPGRWRLLANKMGLSC